MSVVLFFSFFLKPGLHRWSSKTLDATLLIRGEFKLTDIMRQREAEGEREFVLPKIFNQTIDFFFVVLQKNDKKGWDRLEKNSFDVQLVNTSCFLFKNFV